MTEPQFLYDRSGKPLEVPQVFEPTGTLNAKCPTCGNRYTRDLPSRNTSGRSIVTTKPVRCDDCDTTFDVELDEPIKNKMKKAPILGDVRKGTRR